MLHLAIDTSGRIGTVALLRDDAVLEERELSGVGHRHAQALVATLSELLKSHEVAPGDCQLVSVSIGPGSFTGLRIGVVCAKTFAYAVGGTLVGVPTLQAVAANAPAEVDALWGIANAQRGELYAARFTRDASGVFQPATDVAIVDGVAWAESLGIGDAVSGPGVPIVADRLPDHCRVLPEELWEPRAARVGHLGLLRYRAGHRDSPAALQPFYLRKSAAEEKREAALREEADGGK